MPPKEPPPPIVDFDDEVLGIWYIQLSSQSDFLGSVTKLPLGRFRMMSRFRYYRDDKSFDSADKKNIYKLESNKPDSLERFQSLMHGLRARTGGMMFELLREGRTTEEMIAIFESWPVVYKRRVQRED